MDIFGIKPGTTLLWYCLWFYDDIILCCLFFISENMHKIHQTHFWLLQPLRNEALKPSALSDLPLFPILAKGCVCEKCHRHYYASWHAYTDVVIWKIMFFITFTGKHLKLTFKTVIIEAYQKCQLESGLWWEFFCLYFNAHNHMYFHHTYNTINMKQFSTTNQPLF